MENWDQIMAVQRMQDYIGAHLGGDISPEALGEAAGYSAWHAARLFREHLGLTPQEYIRALRLTEAAKALRDTGAKVLDVALSANFDSHDGFTRAFRRQFRIGPAAYRRGKPPVFFFVSYPICQARLTMREGEEKPMENGHVNSIVTVTVTERPARKLILLRSAGATDYFSFCEEKGCAWEGLLASVAERLDAPAILSLPPQLTAPGGSATAAGVEVPAGYQKPLPEGYELIELPPCAMLYFCGMPYADEEHFCEAIDIVAEAVERYTPERFGLRWAPQLAPALNFGSSAETGARMAIPIEAVER